MGIINQKFYTDLINVKKEGMPKNAENRLLLNIITLPFQISEKIEISPYNHHDLLQEKNNLV
jgi:hypothetical protein